MSDFRAIGGVSATLRTLLEDRMELPPGVNVNDFLITISTPRSEEQDDQLEGARINLFLYKTTENGYLKNQEIPDQGQPVSYGHPPLSLDLYYLITAYGTTTIQEDFVDETQAHFLLGSAMRVLHDVPVVTEQLETSTGQRILHESLRNQFEKVKLSLEPISLEDLSKVWTALTLPYRLSVAYMVSVVQIESQRPRRFPKPVGEPPPAGPRVFAVPFRSPQISEIRVRRPGDQPDMERPFAYARIGDTLIICGRNFASDTTRVMLSGVDATSQITVLRDDRIWVTIPDDALLQPGPQSVKVVLDVMMGDPLTSHLGFQSNLAVFMLVPGPIGLPVGPIAFPGTLQITGERLFHPDHESLTLIGDEVIRSSDYTTAESTEIEFDLPDGLSSGSYPVRVRVHGAESIDERTLTIP